jgi:hypothetical protein
MRVSVILPFGLAFVGSVLGQQVTGKAIGDQFSKISASMSTFAAALAATEDTTGISVATAASAQLLATIKSATSAVAGLSGQLALLDAASLVIPSASLATAATKLVKDLEARSGVINSVGVTTSLRKRRWTPFRAQSTSSQNLYEASVVPAGDGVRRSSSG